jgi:hypothetical protein
MLASWQLDAFHNDMGLKQEYRYVLVGYTSVIGPFRSSSWLNCGRPSHVACVFEAKGDKRLV